MAVAGEFLSLAAGGRLYIFLLDFLISSSNSGWGRWLGFFGVDFCLVFFKSKLYTARFAEDSSCGNSAGWWQEALVDKDV